MDILNTTERVNTEDKLNTKEENINSTDSANAAFDDAYEWDTETETYVRTKTADSNSADTTSVKRDWTSFSNILVEENNEVTSITTIKERRLLTAQTMFKKSIRVSLKSFLIAISLTFLNLFI